MSRPQFLSRGIDYLGDLGAKLRDLQGYRTLAHELIQNADDVQAATSIKFNLMDDALIVENDGSFSDCLKVEQPECPWKEDGIHNHRCDFHRFRHIASGDKRAEAGTTGAFGIGFIAVYQITDLPEFISAGRHWILNELNSEDQRIEVCAGCPKCLQPALPKTRFILPWARDPKSELRRALRAEAVAVDIAKRMQDELERSLPVAMLFLKRLRFAEVERSGQSIRTFQRLDEKDSLILSDSKTETDRIWHIIRGDFVGAADKLREEHPNRIEAKRSSHVTLAIPGISFGTGLLCACLPTEQNVGLPFHVNADFFTTNDRKRLILADDYQSHWNRSALRAAGQAFGQAIAALPAILGASRLWELVSTLKDVADKEAKEGGELVLGEFWNATQPQLQTKSVIYTTDGRWNTCEGSSILLQRDEAAAIPILQDLGLKIVHEDLRPYQSLLRNEVIGVPLFNVERLCDALTDHELDRRIGLAGLPLSLRALSGRDALWGEIAILLERQQRSLIAKAHDVMLLKRVAIAPGRDGALWPCDEVYSADNATMALFETLELDIQFISNDGGFDPLKHLCRPFTAAAAIEALSHIGAERLQLAWQEKRLPLRRLFRWFENRRQEIFADRKVVQKLAAITLFPSSGKLRDLNGLALPGNFDDPLGLAEIIDLVALEGRREFLQDLGMQELDFRTYVVSRLPSALSTEGVSVEKRRAAVILLADHAGAFKDDVEVRAALASTPIVECTDGQFRRPAACYFDTTTVRECLGDGAHFAVLPQDHAEAVRDFYGWLGVSDDAGLADVASRVLELCKQPYSPATAKRIVTLVTHLGNRIKADDDPVDLKALRQLKWLPAKGRSDRWYSPGELYASYQEYLFESQANFVDVPIIVQTASRSLFVFLGLHLTPQVDLVVRHLIHCATHIVPVNAEVYRYLNDKVGEPAVGQLAGIRCLLIDNVYQSPSHVYWSEHPFGRYRRRLGEELRSYSNLLARLGVHDAPDHSDALNVLKEISKEFGTTNLPLDADAQAVLMACWQILESALDRSILIATDLYQLHELKCVPNVDRILNPPDWMFFENRAGLAAKFGEFLTKNVIARPLGAAHALAAAGVRPLGSAVEIELLECSDPADDEEMTNTLRLRQNEIGRVLDSQGSGQAAAGALARLANIRCQATANLSIRYSLAVFGRELGSAAEQVPALYQYKQDVLLFGRRKGQMPWSAIARELAIALFPEEDPGRFAAGLKEVLAAETASEAAQILDELGFARLDTAVHTATATFDAAGMLGADLPLCEIGEMVTPAGEDGPKERENLTPGEALKRLLGDDTAPPTPPVHDPSAEPVGPSSSSGGGKSARSARKGRPVLRSYLAPSTTSEANQEDWEDKPSRSPVDEAGVRRVMDYERTQSRIPKEMPHKNPGFDIESRDVSGKVSRFIEVKSFSGPWRNTYAVLSRPQFDKATDSGDAFWLYVVERAESDDCEIHRVQNPARKANHFMFDDGWRATAEPSPSSEEGP